MNDLEHVHGLNPEIGAQARVPLRDQPAVSVSYEHLLDMEEKYGPEYELHPEEAKRAYTVRELLEGVRRDRQSDRKGEKSTVTNINLKIGDNVTFSSHYCPVKSRIESAG